MALIGVAGTPGCSGDDDEKAKGKETPAGPASPAPAFAFNILAAEVRSPAPQAPPFPEDLKGAVKASLDTYLANGVVGPLSTGKPPAGLDNLFSLAAGVRLAPGQPDRAVMLEEGQPVSGKVTQDKADVRLTALLDPGGAPAVVTAIVDIALTVKGKGTTLTVARGGELALVFENNSWRIDSFDLRTVRDTR